MQKMRMIGVTAILAGVTAFYPVRSDARPVAPTPQWAVGAQYGTTHVYVAAPAQLIEKAQKIEAVCQRHGVELGAAAMQFPLFHPAVCSVIPGALSVAEVKQNVARLSAKIPVELWSELKREKLLDPNAPTPN